MGIRNGPQLKIARKNLKMSQYRLARNSGLARSRISLIENGYLVATVEDLKKLNVALSPGIGGLANDVAESDDQPINPCNEKKIEAHND